MKRIRFHPVIIGIVLTAAGAGCAQQPRRSAANDPSQMSPTARAAYYGVSVQTLEMAARYGYRPRIRGGTTLFCRNDAQTGSYLIVEHCVDAVSLRIEAQQQRQVQQEIRQTGR